MTTQLLMDELRYRIYQHGPDSNEVKMFIAEFDMTTVQSVQDFKVLAKLAILHERREPVDPEKERYKQYVKTQRSSGVEP